jgi:hypothetical protein
MLHTIVQELFEATRLRFCCQKDGAITPSSSTAVSMTCYGSIVQLYMDVIKEEVALGSKFSQQERSLA